jgi:hypothetical protein
VAWHLGHVAEQEMQLVRSYLQDLAELGPQPGLGLSLATLPADDRSAFHPEPVGESFLGKPDGLPALG